MDPAGGRKPINAKCETVRDLPTFRDAYRKRRCIASGWLLRMEGDQRSEGKADLRDSDEGRGAVRHRRHLGELEGACFGRMDSDLCNYHTDANELVADIHDRMPVILALGDYARWLGEEPDPRDVMRPFPADPMRMWPISTRVNKPENDDPSIVEPIEPATDAA
jgi:putative SOS response-associated peptidase YedK